MTAHIVGGKRCANCGSQYWRWTDDDTIRRCLFCKKRLDEEDNSWLEKLLRMLFKKGKKDV